MVYRRYKLSNFASVLSFSHTIIEPLSISIVAISSHAESMLIIIFKLIAVSEHVVNASSNYELNLSLK